MSDYNYPTASLTRRLAALTYDSLVVLAVYIISGFVLVGGWAAFHDGEAPGPLPASVSLSLLFCICFFYYSTSWKYGGQTIGMKAWRIRLIHEEKNRPLQLSQFMLRTAIGFFSITIFGIGFWWMLLDKRQRTWHDMASLTRIVYLPR